MTFRRVFFWVMIGSVVVLPAWMMFARGLFGAPIGDMLFGQALLAPLLALLIALVVGLTIARKEVRTPRAATWHDVRTVGIWLSSILLLGLFVVDSKNGVQGSALTAMFGQGALDASNALAALFAFGIVIAGLIISGIQILLLVRETKARVVGYVGSLGVIPERPIEREATFEPLNAPQAGRTIRIDGSEQSANS